jgi:hypothetical protein
MSNFQLDPRSQIEQLANINNEACSQIAQSEGKLTNSNSVEIAFRNMAVIMDRLGLEGYATLPEDVKQQVDVVAFIAQDIAPIDAEGSPRQSDETEDDYDYRVTIQSQLHALHKFASDDRNYKDDDLTQSKLRFAIEATGQAFSSVLIATADSPITTRELPYLHKTTAAVVRHAGRLSLKQN